MWAPIYNSKLEEPYKDWIQVGNKHEKAEYYKRGSLVSDIAGINNQQDIENYAKSYNFFNDYYFWQQKPIIKKYNNEYYIIFTNNGIIKQQKF